MSAADWIAKRRAALGLLSAYAALRGMAGDLTATVAVGSLGIRGSDITAAEDDARTSLPRALDALEALLRGHRPVSFSFSWRDGVAMHEVCPGCQDKAGTHPCGCWRDEDVPHVCAVCSDPEHRMDVPWPCMTVQTIASALRGDRDDHV